MAEEVLADMPDKGNFRSLVDQQAVWDRLTAAFRNGRISSAYLFQGPAGTGKEGFALKFAALLNCRNPGKDPCGECPSCTKFGALQHPNLTLVVPLPRDRDIKKDDPPARALSDKTLATLQKLTAKKGSDPYCKIDLPRANTILLVSIRYIRKKIYLKSIESGRKMIILFDAHKLMTQQAESGNALLKILEEPPADTTFVLTTEYPERLSETIRSRCQGIYFPPVPEKDIVHLLTETMGKEESEALLIAHFSQGNVRTARSLAREKLEELDALLDSLIDWTTSGSGSGWRSFLHHGISVYRTDAGEFSFHLQLLSYWFRDAMYLQKGDGDAELILGRREARIREFAKKYPDANFPEIISSVETCTHSLSRNRNINLVLTNLLLDIELNLKGGGVE
ncbi:MAG: DNA polymerase III subunit [Candidatus Neomarinimicrobiota bacterium]